MDPSDSLWEALQVHRKPLRYRISHRRFTADDLKAFVKSLIGVKYDKRWIIVDARTRRTPNIGYSVILQTQWLDYNGQWSDVTYRCQARMLAFDNDNTRFTVPNYAQPISSTGGVAVEISMAGLYNYVMIIYGEERRRDWLLGASIDPNRRAAMQSHQQSQLQALALATPAQAKHLPKPKWEPVPALYRFKNVELAHFSQVTRIIWAFADMM